MTTEEPTQLDRIEAKVDRVIKLLAPPKLKIDFSSDMNEEQQKKFAEAFKREFTEKDRKRNQRLFLMPEPPQDKPKWGRWKTVAAIVGMALGLAAVAVGSWWLWGVFIRMHV